MTFREKLVRLRKIKGVTQDELAMVVGVSRQAVYKWESGQSYPEALKLVEIKNLLGISIDDLLDDNYEVVMPEKKKRRRRKANAEAEAQAQEVAAAEAAPAPVAEEPKAEPAPEAAPAPAAEPVKEEPKAAPAPKKAKAEPKAEEPKAEDNSKKASLFARLFGNKK